MRDTRKLELAAHGRAHTTKIAVLVALLRRPQGARLDEMMRTTGWPSQAVRAALSGAIGKKLGLLLLSEKTRAGRVYRAVSTASQWGDAPPRQESNAGRGQ